MMMSMPDNDPLAANDDPDITEQIENGFDFNIASPGELPPGQIAAIAARDDTPDGWQFWAIRVPELTENEVAALEGYAKTLVHRLIVTRDPAQDSWVLSENTGQWWLGLDHVPDDFPDLSFLDE